MSDQVNEAIAAIKAGDKGRGRDLLMEVLRTDKGNERAWLWLSAAVDGDDQIRFCLEQAVAINPANEKAKQGLARLAAKQARVQEVVTNQVTDKVAAAPIAQTQEVPTSVEVATPEEVTAPEEVAVPMIAAVPGNVKRRIWFNPKSRNDRVVLLYPNALVLANPSAASLRQLKAIGDGPLPASLLGSDAKQIPLNAIEKVTASPESLLLNVRYRQGAANRQAAIVFSGTEERDEALEALHQELGSAFTRAKRPFSLGEALAMPGCLMFVLVVLAVAGFQAVSSGGEPVIRGRNQLFKYLFYRLVDALGPIGVVVVSLILLALLAVWTVRRVQQPPAVTELTKVG
jgi:hypothetical protein